MSRNRCLLFSLPVILGAATLAFAQPQAEPMAEPQAVAPEAIESPAAPAPSEAAPSAEQGLVIKSTIEGQVVSINMEQYQIVVQGADAEAQTILVAPNDIARLKVGDSVKIQVTHDNVAGSVEIVEPEPSASQ